jgi:hypothetical protein
MTMSNPRFNRFREAYFQMWKVARYRPEAPGDGCGSVDLRDDELKDPERLDNEATEYAARFYKADDDHQHRVGCSNFDTNRGLVYTIEAARALCGGSDDLALHLLRMVVADPGLYGKAKRRNLSS